MELTEKEIQEVKNLLSGKTIGAPLTEFLKKHNHDENTSTPVSKLKIYDANGMMIETQSKKIDFGRGIGLKRYSEGLPNLGDLDVGTMYYNTTWDEVWCYRKKDGSNEWKALQWNEEIEGEIVTDFNTYDVDLIPKYEDDEDEIVESPSYTKYKEYTWNEDSGEILAVFSIISSNSPGDSITCRFYKNGVAVGGEVTVSTNIAQFSSEVISVKNGDKIQVYGKRNTDVGHKSKIDFVKFYYNKCLKSTPPTKE